MSGNGCMALGRNYGDTCVLRPCLEGINSPQAQVNVVVFVSNYFGANKLIEPLSAIPEAHRTGME